ncbi:MAG: hypothetical protein ACRD29_22615 [Acidimicrobiales bacterium]
MIELAELEKIVGTPFPGGKVTVEPYEHWLLCDVVQSTRPPDGVAHPLYVYIAALSGMGLTVDELFALCGATAEDGPMFGEHETEIHEPLRVGATYDVRGRVTAVDRKHGRTAGTFDLVFFELDVADPASGDVRAVCRNSFVFPRRD